MGADAARLYQFCRVLDDMADGDIENGQNRLVPSVKFLTLVDLLIH